MTTTAVYGYLERPYLDTIYPYLTGFALASTGMRCQAVINSQSAVAVRAKPSIINAKDAIGARAQGDIVNFLKTEAMRTLRVISVTKATGVRTKRIIVQYPHGTGMRAERIISNHPTSVGSKLLATKLLHLVYGNYLTGSYLSDPYLIAQILAIEGMRAKGILSHPAATGMRARGVLASQKPVAVRAQRQIIAEHAYAMRALATKNFALAMSAFAQLYNTNNLRILSEFASRGASSGTGTNAWGGTIATGQNWSASSTQAGDFGASNMNTDIDEQIWRSADTVMTSIILKCDTEVTQGVFVDTLSLRNHNLTTSAVVRFEGSNDSGFVTVGTSNVLSVTVDNLYWIAADAPLHGYRYWRVVIDDPTNPNGHVQIGTVLFGRAQIFQGESHTDEVDFSYKDFADTVATEGFTSVTNSRALRKMLHLEFRVLRFDLGNFKILRSLSTTYRTTHKLLWIPTPDPIDMNQTSRFAVFGKLSAVPQEKHNWKGVNADYVDVSVDIDESR